MKKKNYGIQEVCDKDGSLTSRFKTVTSKKEAKSSVGLILTGFIEPDTEYLVQELGREDKYLMITKVKPPQIPESIESLDTKKENKKVENINSNKKVEVTTSQTTPQELINPVDFEAKKIETMGFKASPCLINNLISLIALPLAKDRCEFRTIVLHFDGEKKELWWSNKVTGGCYLLNFGHATYDYFINCWGDGEIALSASRLLGFVEMLKNAREVTFWANLKQKTYGIQEGEVEIFQAHIDAISEINTHKSRVDYTRNQSENQIKLDDNYIPILYEEIAPKYGGIINASELKKIVGIGRKLKLKTYPIDFTKNSPALIVTFQSKNKQLNIPQRMALTIKENSLIPPDVDISQSFCENIEAPAMALEGDEILRLGEKDKAPIYLLKIEKNEVNPKGVMFAGMLLGSRGKTSIVSHDNPRIEISHK